MQDITDQLSGLGRSAAKRSEHFRQLALSLCAKYERETGRPAPEDMADWEWQFRAATDPAFARLVRQVESARFVLLGY
ncbi:MAG: hypothetical protein CL814_00915 [Confluentimicrobium sp.]|uniref:hypothetical protein n=1 Tax=Actibacterium sp. TaxID=1872125 RepID=UPI000C65AD7F|nr:hypothetical protein [Actibacterium sp.]MBC55481.1 hypothetical protein [Actibacterium sp.]|tara:strand:+ start:3003 stop:3236 length:234 start_codon:yes stop_codon:yes gene_type:complete